MDRSLRTALRRRSAIATPALGLALAAGVASLPLATAAPITNEAIFGMGPSTLITFDTDGAGQAVSVSPGTSVAMPANAYAAQGVTFGSPVNWVNDGNASFSAAQGVHGLGPIAIPGGANNTFDIMFSVPVRAFGMWVVNNMNAATLPSFTAFGAGDVMLETVVFDGAFIDGTVGIAEYGFMGILAGQDITRVTVTKQGAIFDNLRFTAIPTPGVGLMIGAAVGAGAIGRRRRA